MLNYKDNSVWYIYMSHLDRIILILDKFNNIAYSGCTTNLDEVLKSLIIYSL